MAMLSMVHHLHGSYSWPPSLTLAMHEKYCSIWFWGWWLMPQPRCTTELSLLGGKEQNTPVNNIYVHSEVHMYTPLYTVHDVAFIKRNLLPFCAMA